MMKLYKLRGFKKYLFDATTGKVWSRSAKRFIKPNTTGKYVLIADNAKFATWKGKYDTTLCGAQRLITLSQGMVTEEVVGENGTVAVVGEMKYAVIPLPAGSDCQDRDAQVFADKLKAEEYAERQAKATGRPFGLFVLSSTVVANQVVWK
jgi:hypothetical protein